MGMFDNVIVECELPDNPPKELRWQSKDLECAMNYYKIAVDGRLMRQLYRVEDRSADSSEGWKDLAFHGILNFYGSSDADEWFEYNAKFTDGKLVSITRIPYSEAQP